ncbi:MAG: epoxyqueuosine reductase [Deltaproteobacteria bacterium]|nr:epoxyqueuosine reductase [Deltaproteobacteria bacterium]
MESLLGAYTAELKKRIRGWGADLVGVADIAALEGLRVEPLDLLDPFSRAIAIAVRLPRVIFQGIEDRPTPLYKAAYETANRLLDEIAFKTAVHLEDAGYESLPIPASQILDWEGLYGAVSHKAVARVAGLGWQGKSLLLVTPQYGPRVRLVTVLTQAPLDPDSPLENRCGECNNCRDACPAEAIKGVNTEHHYKDREEALFFSRCVDQTVNRFAKLPGIGTPICGICIKVCPYAD